MRRIRPKSNSTTISLTKKEKNARTSYKRIKIRGINKVNILMTKKKRSIRMS